MCVFSIGPIQAIAFSAAAIAIAVGVALVVEEELNNRHERKMKRMEQAHETTKDTFKRTEQ